MISIIMNNYNKELYLKQCLNSIINQTYQNFEVIFWDDNSTDNSVKIFKEMNLDPCKYKFYSTEKIINYKITGLLPLGVTRWLALQQCKGDFIALLDSDDFWDKNKLAKQLFIIKNFNNIGLIFSDAYYYKDNKIIGKFHDKYPVPKNYLKCKNHLLLKYNYIPACTILFDKNKLLSVLGSPTHYTSGEDYDWLLKVSEKYDAIYINKALSYYRIVSNSLTNDKRKSTRATWYEIDACVAASKRNKNISRYKLKKHLLYLYCKLLWKQFIREKL